MSKIFQTNGSATELYRTNSSKATLASVEYLPDDGIIRAVTTQELLWFDERQTARPLISFKHGRNFDRTLESRTCIMSQSQSAVDVYSCS